MEMLKDACTHELRELLNVWHGILNNPNATKRDLARVRVKINGICDMLDRLERNGI